MQTTVELQNPAAYLPIWPVLALIFVGILIFLQIFYRRKLSEALHGPKPAKVTPPPPRNIPRIKQKYLRRLATLEKKAGERRIEPRDLYLKLSNLVRMFTFEATGIKVQHYTLNEIRALHMPALTALVQEYYEPEFARSSNPDIYASIERTRKMIRSWF